MQLNDAFHIALKISAVLVAACCLAACGDRSQQQAEKKSPAVAAAPSKEMPQVLTGQINSAPLFESQQSWSGGYVEAIGHGPGVVVGPGGDNPNVFAQQFPANPNEPFKVIARASSVDKPKSMGRIQINWVDRQGKFISVSSKVFEVTLEEKTFEHYTAAPTGAAAGTLYVVADGAENVVRYTEMRLLGKEEQAKASPVLGVNDARLKSPPTAQNAALAKASVLPNPFPKPPNLTPLDGSGHSLTIAESQYYFYHAAKAMQRKAHERNLDFIMYLMPDYNISRLMPAIQQLRAEGIKVLAYESQGVWTAGVDTDWFWQKADSHWTEAAVRLTADEILRMWKEQDVTNRPFSKELMTSYANGFPVISSMYDASIKK